MTHRAIRVALIGAGIACATLATAQGVLPQRINDSGLTTCYAGGIPTDSGVVATACSSTTWPGQDAANGRDAVMPAKIGAGDAGFDFTKLSNGGAELPASAQPGSGLNDWACTRDNVTGLVWQIAAVANLAWGGAQALARDANAAGGACGFDDWRLPSAEELEGIVDFRKSSPAIDTTYFPATASAFHWTAEADPSAPSRRARVVNFAGGFVHAIEATQAASARLVRGGGYFGAPTDNGDGTVTEPRSGLMWDRCALGQDAANACAGDATFSNWQDALVAVRTSNTQHWRGHDDWRLPNVKELATLVDAARHRPAIDTATFPNTAASAYWSSTTDIHVTRAAWAVFFGEGDIFAKEKSTRAAIRLVRTATAASAGGARDALFADGFDAGDASPQTPQDTLPTIALTVSGTILRDTYIAGSMTITATPDSPAYSGTLTIKGHGNSTWGMPKKPYRIKLDTKDHLLGMHSDKNWVLLANYSDKTLMRNLIAQTLGQQMQMAWSPDSRLAKVTLNGQYQGVYQLIENIRVDSNRVNITEMEPTDINPPEVTGGYLFEIDGRRDCAANVQFDTGTGVPICIDTPDDEDIVTQQYDYLRSYMQSFESALYASGFADPATGYRAWLDPSSFIDWYLVNELTANVDSASFGSIWNYKDRNGLLQRGPLWDFDISTGNADYCACADPQGFWVHGGTWYARLFQDPAFAAQARARWNTVKADVFDMLPALIDADADTIRGSVGDNFQKWPIADTWVWPNVVITGSWEGDVAYDKDWFLQRIDWLDAHL